METLFTPASLLLFAWVLAITAFHYTFRKRSLSYGKQYSKVDLEDINNNNAPQKSAVKIEQLVAPGPKPLPIIGNLHHLAKFEKNPYAGFTELAKKYGPIYSLKMGTTPALVVSSNEGMKEVLITKGPKYDGRPNLHRWNLYFDGDRQKSLALCDWSDLQKSRRAVIRSFLLMKVHSKNHNDLDVTLTTEMESLMTEFNKTVGSPVMAKIPIQLCAMNVFMKYMCDTKFEYSDPKFQKITENFDLIFEDINKGHPTDFLPWLSPLFGKHLKHIKDLCEEIRGFLLEHIVSKQLTNDSLDKTKNVLEGLLANNKNTDNKEISMDWENMLFALEDLLAGSSVIGNIMLRSLTYIAQNPEVQRKLREEADKIVGQNGTVSIDHRTEMPYTESTIMEVLRHTSSPIVPHVANQDTTLGDYHVEKGTVIFINNYAMNFSEEHWDEPLKFKPERFLKEDGSFFKPSHFLPFSTGKRACIGSKMLMHVTFVMLVNMIQRYEISIPSNETPYLPLGRIAVDGNGFKILLNDITRN